jgi:hypothetical protein
MGRRSLFLVRMRSHQRRVNVHDHLTTVPAACRSGQRPPPGPHRGPRLGTGRPDRRQHGRNLGGEGADQPRHRRIAGHRTEDPWLGADHREVGQAVPTERDRGRHITHDLPRIVDRAPTAPWRERDRQRPLRPRQPQRLPQQQPAGRRHQPLARRIKNDTGTCDTLHLRSAFLHGDTCDFAIPSFPCRTGTSAHLRPGVAHHPTDISRLVDCRG